MFRWLSWDDCVRMWRVGISAMGQLSWDCCLGTAVLGLLYSDRFTMSVELVSLCWDCSTLCNTTEMAVFCCIVTALLVVSLHHVCGIVTVV